MNSCVGFKNCYHRSSGIMVAIITMGVIDVFNGFNGLQLDLCYELEFVRRLSNGESRK